MEIGYTGFLQHVGLDISLCHNSYKGQEGG